MSSILFILAKVFGLIDTNDDLIRLFQFVALDSIAIGVAFIGWVQWKRKP